MLKIYLKMFLNVLKSENKLRIAFLRSLDPKSWLVKFEEKVNF